MLHIATVHWRTDRWIDIQQRYLERFVNVPFRVYASLDGLDNSYRERVHYATSLPGRHEDKLDVLARMIVGEPSTNEEDWLLFLDGDAFPIADLAAYADARLSAHSLIAVQRRENNGDIQPHPSFCLTTVGFWQEIGGTWTRGFQWEDTLGRRVTDVGGNLLKILQDRGIDWYPVLRSNDETRGPVVFGIYDGVVYHHGAGFRRGCSRRATEEKKAEMWDTLPFKTLRAVHGLFPRHRRLERIRRGVSPTYWARQLAIRDTRKQHREVYNLIRSDDQFFEKL